MIVCVSGDSHGAIDRLYGEVQAFETTLGVLFDWVLHVGDLGVWPMPERIDKATRKHEGPGDFGQWFAEGQAAPRPTVFIKGNHEDFEWLRERERQRDLEVLPNIHYLPNGRVKELADSAGRIRVGGIGGCYGPSDYEIPAAKLQGGNQRHFTRDEVLDIGRQGLLDILLLHDAPAGVEFVQRDRNGWVRRRYTSDAKGLAEAVQLSQPRLCFFGHHHTRVDATVAGVRCLGLSQVPHPGSLVALDVPGTSRAFSVLGEWPR